MLKDERLERGYWELLYQLLVARARHTSNTLVTPGPQGRDVDAIYVSSNSETVAVFELNGMGVKCSVDGVCMAEVVDFDNITRLLEMIKKIIP